MKAALITFAAAIAGLFIVVLATYVFTGDALTAGRAGGLYLVPWVWIGWRALWRASK